MQTFLPYASFTNSASCLDRQRLGKQRVEVLQIANALSKKRLGISAGWINHPAVKMWVGHEYSLLDYGLAICCEWVARGYKDTCLEKIALMYFHLQWNNIANNGVPSWIGNDEFHNSHRSALLRKDINHYKQFNWDVDPTDPYVWPIK